MALELKGISFVLDENPGEVKGLIRAETAKTVFVSENHRIVFTDKRAYIVNGNHEHLSVMWRSDGTQFSLPWRSVQFFQVYPNVERDGVWVEVNDSRTDSRVFVAFRVEGASHASKLSRRLMWLSRR